MPLRGENDLFYRDPPGERVRATVSIRALPWRVTIILLLVRDGSFNRKPEACAIVPGQRITRTPPACG